MKKRYEKLTIALIVFMMSICSAAADVMITSPSTGDRMAQGETILLQADASADGGTVKRVKFYADGRILKTVSSAPYEYAWEQVPMGIYTLTAQMTDGDNNSVMSAPVQIFVGDIVEGDLIKNGEFSCSGGPSPWSLGLNGGAQATFTVDSLGFLADDEPMGVVEIQNAGTENWHVMLIQPLPILAGHTYEIYFLAEVDEAKTIAVDFQNNGGDWAVHLWQDVPLTPGQIEYGPIEYVCDVDDAKNEFKLGLSANASTVYIDQIRVIDKNWEAVTTDVPDQKIVKVNDYRLEQNYPNPFNPDTEIGYTLSRAAYTELSIFNVQGRLIKTLISSVQPAGRHTVRWNGLDSAGNQVPSGIYLYKMNAGQSEISKQMLLLK